MATTSGEACPTVRQSHSTSAGMQNHHQHQQQHFGVTAAAAAAAAAAAWNQQHQQHQQLQHHHPLHFQQSYSAGHPLHEHHQLRHRQHQHPLHQQAAHQAADSPSCWYGGGHLDIGQHAAAAAVFGFQCYSTAESQQHQQPPPPLPPPTQTPVQQQQQAYRPASPLRCSSSPSGIQWLEEAKAISQTLSQETIRDLERFAGAFKQRRVKLGFTQADVGRDIAQLNVAGMGSLSQSTICRFESLTLSHNNMLALRPILEQWLLHAEQQYQVRVCSGQREDKRRRTSIATPERRSLEAYFAVQSRPSSDKIAEIAQKLGLKKSVVRVWFCNQRQKQKRIKTGQCLADQPTAQAAPHSRLLPLPSGTVDNDNDDDHDDFQADDDVEDEAFISGTLDEEDGGPVAAAPLGHC